MIKFGIRQSFDRIEQIEDRYANITAPVEVALPYYWGIYEPARNFSIWHAGQINALAWNIIGVLIYTGKTETRLGLIIAVPYKVYLSERTVATKR
ncbi:MAG: hypothetical protein L6308_00005 [Candidatus Omnitrophica bacterium]|nr:hypothetical protein [Candidatus Omnitrophota bacterium]